LAFGIKARVQSEMLGSIKYDGSFTSVVSPSTNYSESIELSTGYTILFDVLPYFAIKDSITLYVSAGIGVTGGQESAYCKLDSNGAVIPHTYKTKEADSQTTWHLNPYLVLNYGAGAFYTGLRLESPYSHDAKDNAYINWSIPIGITISF